MSSQKRAQRVRFLINLLCLVMTARLIYYVQTLFGAIERRDSFWLTIFKAAIVINILAIFIVRRYLRMRAGKRLVTIGPYRLVAHPAYVTYLVVDLIFWLGGSLTAYAVISGVCYWLVIFAAAYCEEVQLMELVGDQAMKYYHRTPSIHYFLGRLLQRE